MKRIKLTDEEKEKNRYERFIEKQSYRGTRGGKAKGEAYRPLRCEVQKLWSSTALTKKEIAEQLGVSIGFVSKYTSSDLRYRKEQEYLKYEHQDNLAKIRELELRVKLLEQELKQYSEKHGDLKQVQARKKI